VAGSLSAGLGIISVDAANIKEFRGGLFMGGLSGAASGSASQELAGMLAGAYAKACVNYLLGCNPNLIGDIEASGAGAAANALAGAIGGSAVAVSTQAHYKKLPGNTDLIELTANATAHLGCASGAWTSASAVACQGLGCVLP
jgi:hypothetical protein